MSKPQNNSPVVTFDVPADSIDTLPTDQNMPTHKEILIVDTLFKEKHTLIQTILNGTKDVLIVGFIFILLSIPQTDDFIRKFISSTQNSPYILLFVKTLIFMVCYFVVKNIYLVRKK